MSTTDHFSIGWICAIDTEIIAAEIMFDEILSAPDGIPTSDVNSYKFGRISGHHVVVACLPQSQYGISNATAAVKDMLRSFPVKTVVMVGIAGGAPNLANGVDIRLGDVVVSSPGSQNGGVLQYGYGKKHQDENDPLCFETTGHLNQPPLSMLNAVNQLKATHRMDGHQIQQIMEKALLQRPKLKAKLRQELQRPDTATDRLYQSSVTHAENHRTCDACGDDQATLAMRDARDPDDDDPVIHYGLIASSDSLMKDAIMRDRLSRERNVLCFEMEAAGLMNHVPCIAIRGICDYSDSHKNKIWQGYAAMTAAAYAKELLGNIRPDQMRAEGPLIDRLEAGLSKLNNELSGIKDGIHEGKIAKWLSPPDPSTNRNKAQAQRQMGTGEWFLRSDSYMAWKKERNSFLWLQGIPGCGKTVLSSSIIADLASNPTSSQNLLYFYFDFNDDKKQSLDVAVRSLISQMYSQQKDIRSQVEAVHSSCQEGFFQPSDTSLHKLLQDILHHAGEVWIVLDALDECHKRNEGPKHKLLPCIKDLRDLNLNIHIMVTSRPEQDIKSSIEEWAGHEQIIHLQSSLVDDDIKAYVKEKIRAMDRWKDRPDVQESIETVLAQKANGMFRWAACQFDVLNDCLDWPSVQKELQNLPRSLEATYDRILQNVKEQHRSYATRLLQLLAYSKRSLRLEEVVDAMAVDTSRQPRFEHRNRFPIPHDVLHCCSSLITLVARHHEGKQVEELHLAHSSVQEYLLSSRPKPFSTEDFQKPNASAAILETCLSYLLDSYRRSWTQEVTYPFARYCAQYWLDYAIVVEQAKQGTIPLVLEYLLSEDLQVLQSASYFDLGYPRICLDLSLTDEMDHKDTKYAEALCYASSGGLLYTTRYLLSRGADVNIPFRDEDSPLSAASSSGHLDVVQELLQSGANVNTRGWTPLQGASREGNIEVVQLLLDHGAEVDADPGEYGSPLCLASEQGYTEIVRILLDHGASIDKFGVFGTPLYVASLNGHIETARLLLLNNADVSIQDGGSLHMCALGAASYSGDQDIVRMLLAHCADIRLQDRQGFALGSAASGGHIDIVQILLDHGADVNVDVKILGRGNRYRTRRSPPLFHASQNGHAQLVQFLLDYGANINSPSDDGSTPLVAASYFGHTEVVEILLAHGAHVNIRSPYGNALKQASSRGYVEVVRVLLNHGAHDVDSRALEVALEQETESPAYADIAQLLQSKDMTSRKRIGAADTDFNFHKKRRMISSDDT